MAVVELLGRPPVVEVDESAARRTLRDQVARLEHELAMTVASARPRIAMPVVSGRAGPRLLTLGELETLRDELAGRLGDLRAEVSRRADDAEAKRVLIERMLLEPGRHKWVRVTNEDLGEPGCKSWHVRPRLGLIGMLAGWWHVKISSGCPLAA
jgi:hypothetical protein